MHERFAEGWRAAGYVGSGIATDFGENSVYHDALIEITLHARGKAVRKICKAHDAGKAASELCRNFPRATVHYHPDSAYGFVAQIRCHCGREKSCGCCRADGMERATITIVLVQESSSPNVQRQGRAGEPMTDGIPGVW